MRVRYQLLGTTNRRLLTCLAQDGLVQDPQLRLDGVPLPSTVRAGPCAQDCQPEALRVPVACC